MSILSRDEYKDRKSEGGPSSAIYALLFELWLQTADSVKNCVIAGRNRKSLYVEIGNHCMSIGNHGTSEISYAKSARVGPLDNTSSCCCL